MLWSKTYNGLAEVVDCQAVVPRSALAGADVAIASVQCPVPHISSLNSSHCCTLNCLAGETHPPARGARGSAT